MIVTYKTSHTVARRAFTILELIVAISITVIMLLLINALFQATSNGVSMGMALSDVIGAGRAIGDQIERDAGEQLKPIENGIFVVVCSKRDGVPYKVRGVEASRSVRSDQFMFIRRIGNSANGFGSAPIAPLDDSTYSSPTKTQVADTTVVRVWYGHVLKTNEAGTATTALGADGLNKFANQWALGRHALFLNGSATALTFNSSSSATVDAPVTGISLPGLTPLKLHHGLTDVARLKHQGDAVAALAPPGVFVATGVGTGGINSSTLWTGDLQAAYATKALTYMFIEPFRLWVNPFPKIDPTQTATWATSGQVAQMHSLLMDNISDFIVEIAADAVDDPPANAPEFDGEPDRDTAGEIIWYGMAANTATNSQGPPNGTNWTRGLLGLESPVVSGLPANVNAAYVFRHGLGNEKL